MQIKNVTVFCASSRQADSVYRTAARQLGTILAQNNLTVIYGGGAVGSMGALAEGALAAGGQVIGVIPRFMVDLEWAHPHISELKIVNSMHERKQFMLEQADAVVALPGGCGTLEELFEAITWKRLGFFNGPIILVNTRHFYDPWVELLKRTIEERFMAPQHASIWTVVQAPDDVLDALKNASMWPENAISFAAL